MSGLHNIQSIGGNMSSQRELHPIKVLIILKCRTIPTFNRKHLAKAGDITNILPMRYTYTSFFFDFNATVSFGNCLTLSISRYKNISLDWQTDKTDNSKIDNSIVLIIHSIQAIAPPKVGDFQIIIHSLVNI